MPTDPFQYPSGPKVPAAPNTPAEQQAAQAVVTLTGNEVPNEAMPIFL